MSQYTSNLSMCYDIGDTGFNTEGLLRVSAIYKKQIDDVGAFVVVKFLPAMTATNGPGGH